MTETQTFTHIDNDGTFVTVVTYGSVVVIYTREGHGDFEYVLPRPAFDGRMVALPCPICNDAFVIAVAGPDENGQYDTDDCPCQTVVDQS